MIQNKLTSVIVACAVAGSMLLTGCQSGSFSSGRANLNSNIDSVSYAFGYLNGQQMEKQGMSDLNANLFAKGLQNALDKDSSVINKDTLIAVFRGYQAKSQRKAMKMRQDEGKKNAAKGAAFLKENKTKDGVKTTDSGLQYKVLEKGSGKSPAATDSVTVNYKGTLLNGEVFDSSYKRGEPATFPLNRVIKGWTEGVQLMHEGAKYKFWIPGNLAYGPNPQPGGPIGPNQLLVFEVELIKVK